jgi:DNA-binding response OmpR family regulator
MRLLLVEDELDLGSAIQKTLNQSRYVVDWVQDGHEAWNFLDQPQTPYILAVFDWMLPGMSGLELCRRLRSRSSSLPVLMLTARDGMADKIQGLDAGADDYLVKPFGIEELLARLRALQRRSPMNPVQQLRVGPLQLDYSTASVAIKTDQGGRQPIALTAKEFQLLEYFMQYPKQILTHEQIRHRLWDYEDESSSNVIAAQVRRLRRKLMDCGCEDLIETARGIGYRLNL